MCESWNFAEHQHQRDIVSDHRHGDCMNVLCTELDILYSTQTMGFVYGWGLRYVYVCILCDAQYILLLTLDIPRSLSNALYLEVCEWNNHNENKPHPEHNNSDRSSMLDWNTSDVLHSQSGAVPVLRNPSCQWFEGEKSRNDYQFGDTITTMDRWLNVCMVLGKWYIIQYWFSSVWVAGRCGRRKSKTTTVKESIAVLAPILSKFYLFFFDCQPTSGQIRINNIPKWRGHSYESPTRILATKYDLSI